MANISKYLKDFIATLKPVATSGSYIDLINKPTISTAGASGSYTDLINKPILGTAAALNVGIAANQLVQIGNDGKLPAVNGSNLTNIIASGLSPSVPYSVNSAKTDSNGYANFITKIDNSTIGFDTNSGSTPIKITYPDGSIEINNTLPDIGSIAYNATYTVIKEKGLNPYCVRTYVPTESIIAPLSPINGQLWLDISVVPYIPKKWDGSAWVVAQYVKLGEFTRTAAIIGTPISYALNRRYKSDEFNVFINTTYTRPDNLGTLDANVELYARCISAEHGYAINSIVKPIPFTSPIANRSIPSVKYDRNSSRFCSYDYGDSGMIIPSLTIKTDAGMTSARWKFFFVVQGNF